MIRKTSRIYVAQFGVTGALERERAGVHLVASSLPVGLGRAQPKGVAEAHLPVGPSPTGKSIRGQCNVVWGSSHGRGHPGLGIVTAALKLLQDFTDALSEKAYVSMSYLKLVIHLLNTDILNPKEGDTELI